MPDDGAAAGAEPVAGAVPPAPPRPRTGLAGTFRSLRHRNYRLYFFGQLISLVGSWMQITALTWVAFELTGQSRWTAAVSAAQILPTFFLGAWAGTLADRWSKRNLIFVTQTAFMIQAFLLAGLVYFGTITPWLLFVVTLLGGLVQAIDLPARLAFVTDMAGREDLMNAVALNSVLFNLARIVGPMITGWFLGSKYLGAAGCFLANGISYAAVLWALAQMTVTGAATASIRRGGWSTLSAGFRYLASHRGAAYLLLLVGTTSLCGWPFAILLPAFSDQVLETGKQGYSQMLSGTGIGALAAAWAVATFGTMERRRPFIIAGVCVVGMALEGLSLAHGLPMAVIQCGLIGFGLILFLSTSQTIIQLRANDENRGAVMGIYAMTLSGAVPLGQVIFGPAADELGVPAALRFQGAVCLASALVLAGMFILPAAESGRDDPRLQDDAVDLAEPPA